MSQFYIETEYTFYPFQACDYCTLSDDTYVAKAVKKVTKGFKLFSSQNKLHRKSIKFVLFCRNSLLNPYIFEDNRKQKE